MARARGRGRRELKSEINIVPLLDVLLVLLLIFMATAPIITQSVEVDLPDATESIASPAAAAAGHGSARPATLTHRGRTAPPPQRAPKKLYKVHWPVPSQATDKAQWRT